MSPARSIRFGSAPSLSFVWAILAVAGCDGTGLPGTGPGMDAPDMATSPTRWPGVISISGRTDEETEPHVVASSTGVVCVAWVGVKIADGSSSIGYRFSSDDGMSFAAAGSIAMPAGVSATNPVLAVDAAGNFYLTFLAGQPLGQGQVKPLHVFAARAKAGSQAFAAPVLVDDSAAGATYEKPWILVENDGSLLITYSNTASGKLIAAHSTDLVTFTRTFIVADPVFRNLMYPCKTPTGSRVYVVYIVVGNTGLRWSDDGGLTWPDANKISVVANQEGPPAFDDPTCAADGMEVWALYSFSSDSMNVSGRRGLSSSKLTSIRLAHSSDGGRSFDRRSDANDLAAGALSMHPTLLREPGGTLDVLYNAGASDGDLAGSVRLGRSFDSGVTWRPSTQLQSPIAFVTSRQSTLFLGDYQGLATAREHLYIAYADNSGSYSHIAFDRVSASTIGP